METLTLTIEKALDNAFIINRKGTKHRNDFSYNIFERPVTYLDFFQLLANSDINLSSYELTKYMCHLRATDYVNNYKGNVKLIITSSSAMIHILHAEWLNIYLDRSKLIEMFDWFKDESLFNTDFGELKHKEIYYK